MKSFGKYIAKHLVSFALFLALLFLVNTVSFGWTFYNIIIKDYGSNSPQNMLAEIASEASLGGLSSSAAQQLRHHQIWALFLNQSGQCVWSVDAPAQLVKSYTVQDVAVFSKGYLADYPVFVWNTTDGLLVLGYPKDSYTKLTSNYFSIHGKQLETLCAVVTNFDFAAWELLCRIKRQQVCGGGPRPKKRGKPRCFCHKIKTVCTNAN